MNKGIVVINHLYQRGRKLGADIYDEVRQCVPLELAGMGTKEYGGIGEVLHPQLPSFISNYRFMFNPIRYTSFGLSVCEAMMLGMPVVTLATTEYSTVTYAERHFNIQRFVSEWKSAFELAIDLNEKHRYEKNFSFYQ